MNLLRQLATRTRVEGLVIFLVALAYLWEAHNVPEFYHIPGVPGPTTFPYLLGVAFAACGLWLLVSPKDLMARLKDGATAAPPVTAGPAVSLADRIRANWHFVAMWALILGYLWVMPDIGFPLATFVLLAVFLYLLGETRWPMFLGIAFAATAIIYVSFKFGLNVRLPLGVLEPLFT